MKVVVIGSNGQLGSDIISEYKDSIPLTHKDIDVSNYNSLNVIKNIRPDVIINTAAFVNVDDSEKKPEQAFKVNAIGALNVAKISKEIGALNVYISTDYVFDGNHKKPYNEKDIPNPINVYGTSKYIGEIFTRNYSSRYYIIRVASLYGRRGSKGKGGNFVSFIIDKAIRNDKIEVVSDMISNPTYTKDVARMLKKLIEKKPTFGIYHMVNEGYCSWYNFAKEILNILKLDADIIAIKSKNLNRLAKRPLFSAMENRNLNKIGLRMRNWKDALKEYLNSYL